jgi:glycerate 2-kinase
MSILKLRADARAIWDAALAAARPERGIHRALTDTAFQNVVASASRIIVVGGGKAGAAMAAAVEQELADRVADITGVVNVPPGGEQSLKSIRLNIARPTGSNEPTEAGVAGARQMLNLLESAEANDLVIALISGGGSALLPAPVDGVSLEDKQRVTRLLHSSGATIVEMNCVRKHLSKIKGGGLAAIARCPVYSLIISDVVGDPLDVIASGPTAPDPTTFADAVAVLRQYRLFASVPNSVRMHLLSGAAGDKKETLKSLPQSVHNWVIGSNCDAVTAASQCAEALGYRVKDLGSAIEGETTAVARMAAETLQELPGKFNCLLIGGETTVTLPPDHGKGGRNAEFVLAALLALRSSDLAGHVILSGGTDGEDGPTDAAGAIADETTLGRAVALGLDPADFLRRHDSYTFFNATGDLLRTGLTQTNVMDVRVLLIDQ